MAVGGALPSAKILGWLSYCYWDTIIRNSYGATECGSIASDGFISDGVEWKLADWNVLFSLFYHTKKEINGKKYFYLFRNIKVRICLTLEVNYL